MLVLLKWYDAVTGPQLQRELNSVTAVLFTAPTVPAKFLEVVDHQLRIFGRPLPPENKIPTYIVRASVRNVEHGIWSYLLFAGLGWKDVIVCCFLLVECVDGLTAERIVCFDLIMHKSEVATFDGMLTMWGVRLV